MKLIIRLTPDRIHRMVAEEKANHPTWSRDDIREAVRNKLKKNQIYVASNGSGAVGCIDPGTAWVVFQACVFVGKLGWTGWKIYKGDTEIPDDVESWIEAAFDFL